MAFSPRQLPKCGRFAPILAGAALALASAPANAQDGDEGSSDEYLDRLRACQAISVDAERLACFDNAVGTIVAANDAGDLQVVDREDVRQTRRSLFGFSLPDIGLFGGDDDEDEELFTTTITRVRYSSARRAQFTTEEGAVWEMKNIPRRLRRIEPGDSVEFKEASLGYYFVRIDGQMGVKGRRVQ